MSKKDKNFEVLLTSFFSYTDRNIKLLCTLIFKQKKNGIIQRDRLIKHTDRRKHILVRYLQSGFEKESIIRENPMQKLKSSYLIFYEIYENDEAKIIKIIIQAKY